MAIEDSEVKSFAVRPKVFISSTIYDFKDLRSAIKYWLEQLGYIVYASEFNDFDKDLNRNSFDACLTLIDNSDYYILLIGSRAGSFIDEHKKETITMAEYRRAYVNAKKGQLKMVSLVRNSVWTTAKDREELYGILREQYSKDHNLSVEDIEKIATHRSAILQDAEIIMTFIKEVCKDEETSNAIKGKGEFPKANWIHQFDNFADVSDVLTKSFVNPTPLKRAALQENLKNEILVILEELLLKIENTMHSLTIFCKPLITAFQGGLSDQSSIKNSDIDALAIFIITSRGFEESRHQILDQAITSGEFMEYDTKLDRYVVGVFQQLLIELQRNIILFCQRNELLLAKKAQYYEALKRDKMRGCDAMIDNSDAVLIIGINNCMENILILSKEIYNVLEGKSPVFPTLKNTCIYENPKGTPSDRPSREEILQWVKK